MAKRRTPVQKQDEEIEEDPEVVRGGPVGSSMGGPDDDEPGDVDPPADDDPPEEIDVNKAILEAIKDLRKDQLALSKRLTDRPSAPAAKDEPEDDFGDDFEEELFNKPKEVLKKFGDRIVDRVSKKLEGRYSKDQLQRTFWEGFYEAHPDLKEDKDLVQATLDGNLNSLADMPASEASDKLADLTRKRILRYTGKKRDNETGEGRRPANRTAVEGSGNQRRQPRQEEPNKVVTLSDLIRQRREAKRTAYKKVAAKGTAA